jgi:LytR cell envelope-related transcriptional attenuator
MTALSPMGRVPQRRPVPPRVKPHRRPGPWLAFLSVLVVIAVVVWWKVLGAADGGGGQDNAVGCPQANQSVVSMDPKTVTVRVYNATEKSGLARTVSTQLKARKFKVIAASNDPLADTRKVDGNAEIRYGPKGEQQALLLSFWFPGAKLTADNRKDAIVDVAVGPTYRTIATDAQVSKAKSDALAGRIPGNCQQP